MLDDLDIKLDPIEKIEIDTRDMDFDIIEEIPSPIENTKEKNVFLFIFKYIGKPLKSKRPPHYHEHDGRKRV